MTVEREISTLASHVARQATLEGKDAPAFPDKVEALKVLTAYYAAIKKRAIGSEDDEDAPNFANFAKNVRDLEAENGKAAIRDRRGRAPAG